MQIEFVNEHNLIMVHYTFQHDLGRHLESVMDGLKTIFPDHNIIIVPNGKPIVNTGHPTLYIARDTELMMGIVKKFSDSEPGQIILMTDEEMKAINDSYNFNTIPLPEKVNE
ncbi:unnamed protein product [marine sediment metagenome]|uniref:Uncharacterized protein n=1 Tax=marine sediment metagenome TaxID=412755 RepID=X0SUY8_9ZZZZ